MKYLIAVFLVIILIMMCSFAKIQTSEAGMKISKHKAIAIANEEAEKLGYDIKLLITRATKYNTPWNEYLPENSQSDYDIERINKLKNKEYWAVYYFLNRMGHKGGDICIFVDANTGEIITDARWK